VDETGKIEGQTSLTATDFNKMDIADEKQIINADKGVREAMVYNAKGHNQLTYIGLKHLTLMMSQEGQALEVLEYNVKLDKGDSVNKLEPIDWRWYATYKVRNKMTGHESVGMSEASYLENGKYDMFARTKALSKAERNAWRKQIPELKIMELIKQATAEGSVQDLDNTKECNCPLGQRD
jgi:hypothetical protein